MSTITRTVCARIPTHLAEFQLYHYVNPADGKEHLALVLGEVRTAPHLLAKGVLVRVHSECFTGDVLQSQRCDCGEQLHKAIEMIAAEGCGVLIYLRQEGRGIGLAQKLAAYNLQDQGYDTVDANLVLGHQADEREYSMAANILVDLGIDSIRLLTNNPSKIEHLQALGIDVRERIPLTTPVTIENVAYLTAKVERMRHVLDIEIPSNSTPPVPVAALQPATQLYIQQLCEQAHAYYAKTGYPFVTLSYAQSLDGCLTAAPGQPTALSSPQSMVITHALRAAHDTILVGIGAMLADDPRLTVRLVDGPQPQPVALDSHLRMPLQAKVLGHPKGVWVATISKDVQRRTLLTAHGARLLDIPATPKGKVNLRALLSRLGELGVRSLMVEGGAQVLTSFLAEGLANYAVITVAPRFTGGLNVIAGSPEGALPRLYNVRYTPVDADILIWGAL